MDIVLRSFALPPDIIKDAEVLSGRLPLEGHYLIEGYDLSGVKEQRIARRFGRFTIAMTDSVNWEDTYDSTVWANFTRDGHLRSLRVKNAQAQTSVYSRTSNENPIDAVMFDLVDFFDSNLQAKRQAEAAADLRKANGAACRMIARTIAARVVAPISR